LAFLAARRALYLRARGVSQGRAAQLPLALGLRRGLAGSRDTLIVATDLDMKTLAARLSWP